LSSLEGGGRRPEGEKPKFLFSTPSIPLVGGQNSANALLLSSLEGGGRRPEGDKSNFSLFHPLDPPDRGTEWCKNPTFVLP